MCMTKCLRSPPVSKAFMEFMFKLPTILENITNLYSCNNSGNVWKWQSNETAPTHSPAKNTASRMTGKQKRLCYSYS